MNNIKSKEDLIAEQRAINEIYRIYQKSTLQDYEKLSDHYLGTLIECAKEMGIWEMW